MLDLTYFCSEISMTTSTDLLAVMVRTADSRFRLAISRFRMIFLALCPHRARLHIAYMQGSGSTGSALRNRP